MFKRVIESTDTQARTPFRCTIFALILAPKYIPASEVALVLLLENILGPIWVFISPQFREVIRCLL